MIVEGLLISIRRELVKVDKNYIPYALLKKVGSKFEKID